jgi:2,3-bisphosphoglycerate-independent phosphoglycerate mutase
MSFDIEPLDAPGATGSYDSDFASKAAVACAALVSGGFDFALLHVKAVDDTGHDRMLAMKVRGMTQAPDWPRQYLATYT